MNFTKALEIACQVHKNQTDKAGKSYILHPIRVAMRLRTNDEELMSIAVLHDVLEDSSSVTIDTLNEAGFTPRVTTALKYLTHNTSITYEAYIADMLNNLDAMLVKREDLRDNSDITRLKGLTEKDFARMQKYQKAFAQVEKQIKLAQACAAQL